MFSTLRTGNEEDPRSTEDPASGRQIETSNSSSLDWDTRIQYFVGFFCLSIVASFCGTWLLMSAKLTGFCVLTSVSSFLSLAGTCFLSGPINQCKRMMDGTRWLASLLYVGSITLTLVSGLLLENPPLAIIFVVLQYVAMAYYSLSYIPYARQLVSRVLCSCF